MKHKRTLAKAEVINPCGQEGRDTIRNGKTITRCNSADAAAPAAQQGRGCQFPGLLLSGAACLSQGLVGAVALGTPPPPAAQGRGDGAQSMKSVLHAQGVWLKGNRSTHLHGGVSEAAFLQNSPLAHPPHQTLCRD